MRVIRVAPSVFGSDGLYGGSERYPLELARALADQVDCELVTFGPQPATWRADGGLRVRGLRRVTWLHGRPAQPVAPLLSAVPTRAQVVHAHHFRSVPTRMSAVTARVLGVGTAVTDHGLLGRTWGGLVHRLFDRFLAVSQCSAQLLGALPARTQVIYGGADTRRFTPRARRRPGLSRAAAPARPGPGRHLPRSGAGSRPARPVPTSRGPGPPVRRPDLRWPARPRLRAARPGGAGGHGQRDPDGGQPDRGAWPRSSWTARPGSWSRRVGANARDLVVQRFTWRACAERCLAAYETL